MNIRKNLLPVEHRKSLPSDLETIPFGVFFTDHMFTMEYTPTHGWANPEIKPFQPLPLNPATSALHYGQEIFEGQKAFKSAQGDILLFRPEENARRFRQSLRRICMPDLPEELYLEALYDLIRIEEAWIPRQKGMSLYIRPTAIATDACLDLIPSSGYLFFIILSPGGAYLSGKLRPISLWISDTFTRASVGGTGDAKTAGNYAGSLLAAVMAKENGYNQVLWTDACEHRFIEEAGSMNIFLVMNGKLITPSLTGSILPGITRKSILEMSSDMGIEAEERRISIEEIIDGIQSGLVSEIFCVGTAAVVIPIDRLGYKNRDYRLPKTAGPWAQKFYTTLCGIQTGDVEDKYRWMVKL